MNNCPKCGAGVGYIGQGTTFECGTWVHKDMPDVDQSRGCLNRQNSTLAAKVATLEARVSELTDERDCAEAGRLKLFRRCEELEEAEDRLAEIAGKFGNGLSANERKEAWEKAKETKP